MLFLYFSSRLHLANVGIGRRALRALQHDSRPLVISIAGPTAAGKSAVAKCINETHPAEVISVDSVQVYRKLKVGTAKPTEEEQLELKHHLVDIADTHSQMTAGDFARLAKTAVDEVIDKGKLPLLVGGSTLWMDWIVNGIPDAPKANEIVAQKVAELIKPFETNGAWQDALLAVTEHLNEKDKDIYKGISKNNWFRLKRYIVIDFTKQLNERRGDDDPLNVEVSFDKMRGTSPTGARKILLPSEPTPSAYAGLSSRIYDTRNFFLSPKRLRLFRDIDKRCEAMVLEGLIEETGSLILDGTLRPSYTSCKSLGYRQTIEYFCRENFEEDDVRAFFNYIRFFGAATRHYAKDQLNWYRGNRNFLWLNWSDCESNPAEMAVTTKLWSSIPRNEYLDAIDIQIGFKDHISNSSKAHASQKDFDEKYLNLRERLIQFKSRNPTVADLLDVKCQQLDAEETSKLDEYIPLNGFLPLPWETTKSDIHLFYPKKHFEIEKQKRIMRERKKFTALEEVILGQRSTDVMNLIRIADEICVKLRRNPGMIDAFRKATGSSGKYGLSLSKLNLRK